MNRMINLEEKSRLQSLLKVLSPLTVGGVNIKNRLGLAPLNTGQLDCGGFAGPKCLSFYDQYCGSGVGLIYIGGVAVAIAGRANRHSLVLDSSKYVSSIQKIAELAHKKNVRVIVQLEHAGRQTDPQEIQSEIVAASPIPCPVIGIQPRQLSVSEIHEIIRCFGNSAGYASQGGVDFIELHAAHGYLISGFLSKSSNQRSDLYGGTLYNRFRILYEIIEECYSRVSLPLGIRINCRDNVADGLTVEDSIAGILPIKSRLAYISVSGGVYTKKDDLIIPSRQLSKALWKSDAALMRKKVSLPVFMSGNIDTIDLAEQLISSGTADITLIGRSFLADPNLLNKFLDSKQETIQECTDCHECKWHSSGRDSIYCPFNPVLKDN